MVFGLSALWLWHLAPKQHLPWIHDEKEAFAKATAEHKGVMVDFSASWCQPCQVLEKTFGDDDVFAAVIVDFVPLKMDVSANDDAAEAAEGALRRARPAHGRISLGAKCRDRPDLR